MKKTFTNIALCLFTWSSQAQITITNTSMPLSGDTIRYSTAPVNSVGNYTATGANYVWDFSTLTPNGQKLRAFKASSLTPYSFFFFPPKYGELVTDTVKLPVTVPGIPTITDIYNFYKKTAVMFSTEGIGIKLSGIPVPNFFTDEDELYNFPLNYTDRDSTTFKFSTVTSTLIPFVYKKQGYRITEADGWGSITTPYGTVNCLRVITTQYSMDTLRGSLTVGTFTVPVNVGFPNYQRSYQWLTTTEKIPYLEVSGNLVGTNFTPTQVKYRDHIQSFVGIQEEQEALALSVFPNPTAGQLVIITPQHNTAITAEIVDLQGKVVLTQTLTQNLSIANQHTVNVSGLAKGLYVLNLSTPSSKQTLKISVQ
jgi:hypothetical protein